ncbi:pyrrolo-quinoline quinone [Babesia caballi]|uniref:Pyrrolo-quinoline quinone n=1 Tax=Babesia caballi TaxID=5871 RepID=A0AAV4LP64_BABCB|nr:pyrrolo-quinoline quinone [Babesia caballi]
MYENTPSPKVLDDETQQSNDSGEIAEKLARKVLVREVKRTGTLLFHIVDQTVDALPLVGASAPDETLRYKHALNCAQLGGMDHVVQANGHGVVVRLQALPERIHRAVVLEVVLS